MRSTLLSICACVLSAQSCAGYAGAAALLARSARASRVVMAEGQLAHYALDGTQMGQVAIVLRTSAKPMYVVHRKVVNELAARRQGTHDVKTRAEVSGGGRKPYKQKGTGRARQGSIRSPLLVGGGKSFGPKPKDWSMKMNKKERRVATASAIMGVLPRAIVVDDLEAHFTSAKTSMMVGLLNSLPLGMKDAKEPKIVIIAKEQNENVYMSGRNIANLKLLTMSTINVHDIVGATKLVITKSALEAMQERYAVAA
ncbi:ribosomal protein L4 domain-containing protein [Pavlovales sp. CCMP2436]|nr:ribosomal protein L4 domain-containing protein [Pavlovales sp. CCMP2436]